MASIVAQTMPDWELIVCDSESDDGTWEFLQTFDQDPRVHLHRVGREGLYAGWNECLATASAEYIYIAPADDLCERNVLEKLHGLLSHCDDVDLAVCRYRRIDAAGVPLADLFDPELAAFLGEWAERSHRRDRYAELLISLCLGCQWNTFPAVLFRRRLLQRTGLFPTEYGSYGDVAWRVKALLYSDVVYTPECLASWRWHDDQATTKLPDNRHELVYRLTRETLEQNASRIPAQWRKDSDWMHKVLLYLRHEYLMHYHLNRTALKQTPASFLAGVARCAVKEPRYLLRRLSTGLTWNAPEYRPRSAHVQRLIREWGVTWPPTESTCGPAA